MNPLILPAMGKIESLLFFYKDGFGSKLTMKVDLQLNKNAKSNLELTRCKTNELFFFFFFYLVKKIVEGRYLKCRQQSGLQKRIAL